MKKLAVVLAFGCFLVAGATLPSAKSYEILLAAPTQAGSVTLQPGQYRVWLDGTVAVFRNVRGTQFFRTAVKIEDTGVPYEVTRISTSKNRGAQRMDAIEFEGSGTKIEFSSNRP